MSNKYRYKVQYTSFKIWKRTLTVVQSLQIPSNPQEPSSGEQQGGYKEMSVSVIEWEIDWMSYFSLVSQYAQAIGMI